MKMISMSYGQALFDLKVSKEDRQNAAKILRESEELQKALVNPTISKEEKEKVIDKLFPPEIRNFIKVICRNDDAQCLLEAFDYCEVLIQKEEQILTGTLYYVTKPEEGQLARIREYLKKEYQAEQVELELKEDASLIGGFILKVRDKVLDRSLRGKLEKMKQNLAWR
ncbi:MULTISPECIES: ATP synthase F1 subunit delta [Anaerostipes]|uniref:ATP synthase subunit delta n=1 Tax=Anaerostipes butyraticus TaxID=645466 RepID=A0A916Q9E5_9FIRM|nr:MULTISPECIES: ATP synthase F1 subunit delta [Anaerostipes]GFO86779.1 ATP synthase subunit delta [Anaerostipes butyraticus]